MKILLKILKPYKKLLIINAITDAIAMLTMLFMPYVMSKIVDEGIANQNFNTVLKFSAIMLIFSIASLTGTLIANKTNAKLTMGFSADLCKATFEKINSLSYTQYSKIGPSGLLTRATEDIWNMEGAASMIVYTLVTIPAMIVGSAVLAFMEDAVLATVFMLSIPPVMLIVYFFMKPLHGMWEKSDKYVDEQNKIVRERLSGLRVVRAFNNEQKEHARAKFATEEMSKYMIRANVRNGFIDPIAMLLLNLATVCVVWVGGIRASSGLLTDAGDIVAIIQYVALLSGALINLSWTIAWLPRLGVAVKRLNEIHTMKEEDVTVEKTEKAVQSASNFDISVENLTFAYQSAKEPSLRNINMKILSGEKVAVIGGTGSGKTTLSRLILGFFAPTEGEIYIGGSAYSDLSKNDVRERFSIALQKPMIFEGTIRENLKMGSPSATDEDILSALSDCRMSDYVNAYEDGLDHVLVGGGQNVSGGQKQRINLARTVIRQADVYVFDDSFSALDFLTESIIKKNLSARLKGKTQITITQRVSTAMHAEKIFVMDKGEITAVGTHEELIKASDIYREICISQLGKDSVGGVL
ncbi:MAG: ABC transporter ATP-binding protein [Clostridia bacterium]|nr:ABC transporter ATP-binding protein [Clostridia bacterium]